MDEGLDAFPRCLRARVDVGDEPDHNLRIRERRFVQGRERRHHIPVLVELGVHQPGRLQLVNELAPEVELTGRAGARAALTPRLRANPHIAREPFKQVGSELLSERRAVGGTHAPQYGAGRFGLPPWGRPKAELRTRTNPGGTDPMATQTQSQRQAAAKRGAATRKRNTAKRSASATKASARRTQKSASATTREARRTTKQASRTAERGLDAAATRLGVIGRQAERALLIPVGAAATVGEKVKETARTYSSLDRVARELDRFERRGARALNRRQRSLARRRRDLEHEVSSAQRNIENRADWLRADARDAAQQVKRLV